MSTCLVPDHKNRPREDARMIPDISICHNKGEAEQDGDEIYMLAPSWSVAIINSLAHP